MRAVDQYNNTIVKENNGIKKRDIKRLIMPIGISMSDLDQTWLNTMESFGGKRGLVAHTSRLGITVMLDPWSEYDVVKDLITGLEELDKLVLVLLKND